MEQNYGTVTLCIDSAPSCEQIVVKGAFPIRPRVCRRNCRHVSLRSFFLTVGKIRILIVIEIIKKPFNVISNLITQEAQSMEKVALFYLGR